MSTTVTQHCPHCKTKLKIKDDSLFGQTVKCPGCKERFVLRDPRVENPPEKVSRPAPQASKVPVSPTQPKPARKAEEGTFPAFPSFDESDHDQSASPAAPPVDAAALSSDDTLSFPPPAKKTSDKGGFPVFEEPVLSPPSGSKPAEKPSATGPGFPVPADLDEPIIPRRQKKSPVKLIMQGVVGIAAIGVIAFFAMQERKASTAPAIPTPAARNVPEEPAHDPTQPYSREMLEKNEDLVAEFNPTNGNPVTLQMMPSGVNMVLHLHPARLWSNDYESKVLRASLTDGLVSWMASQIESLTKFRPEQIEELTIGVLFGARGVAPQYACVVRLNEPQKLSTMLDLFPGKPLYDITERPDLRIMVGDVTACLIKDDRTFALCPASQASDLEYSINTPNQDASAGLLELLQQTDRDRLVTVVTDLRDLQIHQSQLVPADSQQFLTALTEWAGEDVEMASWSLHPYGYFHSELIIRPIPLRAPGRLEASLREKLAQLPETIWKEVALKMQPREMRFRQLIGRFPAMLEALVQSTVIRTRQRNVLLTTVLPAKATPNLALATLFTIDEASRTNFNVAAQTPQQPTKPQLPETVAERLKVKIDVEFSRTPLEQALTYLCGEIEVKLYVDGDALKDAGYTKNMPQTMNLGKVSVEKALFTITKEYQEAGKEMVVSINEETKTLTVLTKKFAEEKGLPIYTLKDE